MEEAKVKLRVDWQTPDNYLDAVRNVLGMIDLDPASDDRAQLRVKAGKFYSMENSGLDHDWHGNVWLAPPFKLITEFISKLLKHYGNGQVKQAILLLHTAKTWEPWFQSAMNKSDSACFVNELIKWVPGHLPELILADQLGIPHDQFPRYDERGFAFLYYGPNKDKFKSEFSKFGVVLNGK